MSRISCRCKLLASLEKRSLWTNHKPIALLSFSFRPPLTHIRGGEKSNNSPSHPSNLEGSQSLFRTLFGNDEELIFQIGNWFGIWNTSKDIFSCATSNIKTQTRHKTLHKKDPSIIRSLLSIPSILQSQEPSLH